MVTQYHYNPESYLKEFAQEDGSLFRYSKLRQQYEPESGGTYRSYGSQRDLYIEEFEVSYFGKVDGCFVPVRNKLSALAVSDQKAEFTHSDFACLSAFISSQPFRTPSSRGILEQAYVEIPPLTGPLTKDELRIKFGKHIVQYALKVLPKLWGTKLVLCIAPESTPFITSDNVATLFRINDNKGFSGFTDAYLDTGTQIYFPLSSRLCLWITDKTEEVQEKEIQTYDISPEHVSFINAVVYGNSVEYAYSCDKGTLDKAIQKGTELPKCITTF